MSASSALAQDLSLEDSLYPDATTRLQAAMAQDELDAQDATVQEAGGLAKALHHTSAEVRQKAQAVLERSYIHQETYRCRLKEDGDRFMRAREFLRQWRIKFLFIFDEETEIKELWILKDDLARFQECRRKVFGTISSQ